MSDSLWSHGLHPARLPCPSPSPRVCSNSSPLSQWCHPNISSSVAPFFSCPQSFPAPESFPVSRLFVSGSQSIGASGLASILSVNIQGWFPLGWTGLISLLSKGGSRVFSSTTVLESINPLALSFLYGLTLTSIHDHWKNHSFDYTDLCHQSDVSDFEYAVWNCHNFSCKEQASFNFLAAVIVCNDFGEKKICHCLYFFPIYLQWSDGTGYHDLHFLNCWDLT